MNGAGEDNYRLLVFERADQLVELRKKAEGDAKLITALDKHILAFSKEIRDLHAESSHHLQTPPVNDYAERMVLAAMLAEKGADAIVAAGNVLSDHDFYRRTHKHIFRMAVDLHAKGLKASEPVIEGLLIRSDPVSYSSTIDAIKEHDIPTRETLSVMIEDVKEFSLRRDLLRALSDLTGSAYAIDEGGAAELLARAHDALEECAKTHRARATDAPVVRVDWSGTPPIREWIVDGWLPKGRLAILVGEGGKGKSRLAVQLGAAIASGTERWLPGVGCPDGPRILPAKLPNQTDDEYASYCKSEEAQVVAAPVVYWSAEDELEEIHRRLANIGGDGEAEKNSPVIPIADMDDRFHGVMAMSSGPLWAPDDANPRSLGHLTRHGQWLRSYCERVCPRLLILDPLVAANATNENIRTEVRLFANQWGSWAIDKGIAILIVAHPSKTAGAEYSGSSDWHAAVRNMWTFGLKTAIGADPKSDRSEDVAPMLYRTKANYAIGDAPSSYFVKRREKGAWAVSTFDQAKILRPLAGSDLNAAPHQNSHDEHS